MQSLTELDASYSEITDLTGLEFATNLQSLDLRNNQINNVAPLQYCTSLTELNLGANQIRYIAPLSGLTNLTKLSLDFNQVSDFSTLGNFTNLSSLSLNHTQFNDCTELQGLSNLTELSLTGTETDSFQPLVTLTNLTSLTMVNAGIDNVDLAYISEISSIKQLNIAQNQISNVSSLVGLTNLTDLNLDRNQINDLSSLNAVSDVKISAAGQTFLVERQATTDGTISATYPLQGIDGNAIAPSSISDKGVYDPISNVVSWAGLPGGDNELQVEWNVSLGGQSEFSGTITQPYTNHQSPVAGTVTVEYLDQEGNRVSEDTVLMGHLGEAYRTSPKEIEGYTFVEVQGNERGAFTTQTQSVTYIYAKEQVPVVAGDVTVKYQDEAGNSIASDSVLTGNVGEEYNATRLDIEEYRLVAVEGNERGTFTNEAQTVTYTYVKEQEPVAAADVTVKYQDEAGNPIAPDSVLSGHVGDVYRTAAVWIEGYALVAVEGDERGTFTNEAQTVTYTYEKEQAPVAAADVTVKYQDEAGNPIAPDSVLSGHVGEDYHTAAVWIEGYTLVAVEGNERGVLTEEDQEVVYTYARF